MRQAAGIRMGIADYIGWAIIALALLACYFLTGCDGGGEHRSPLPTVTAAAAPTLEAASDAFVVCHDAAGVRPDKLFQVAKTVTPNERFCYVAGECYYGCRQGLPGQ